jgi:fatty-acyl-CoA synthase
VRALVVLRPGATVAAEPELIALVRERKGAVYAPKAIDFVALPVTGLGKLDKKAIRAQFWQGQQRGVS